MGFHQLIKLQDIPADLETIWDFISRPENLKLITPDGMDFEIVSSDVPEVMYPGMIIEYRVSPLKGMRQRWVSEITHIQEGRYFVDEQRVGPYTMWHHEHFVEPIDGAVRMKDIISYKLPFGPLGDLAHALFVRRKLESIFEYRRTALEARYGIFK